MAHGSPSTNLSAALLLLRQWEGEIERGPQKAKNIMIGGGGGGGGEDAEVMGESNYHRDCPFGNVASAKASLQSTTQLLSHEMMLQHKSCC